MVGEDMRAWHAGVSSWEGDSDTNSRSIGIEVHNPGHTLGYRDFPRVQMQAVAALCLDIQSRHAIAPHRILAHSDVAPARKIDPGEKFDWAWLAGQGVGLWVSSHSNSSSQRKPGPTPVLPPGSAQAEKVQWVPAFAGMTEWVFELQQLLKTYGYGIDETGEYDSLTRLIVTAFQRHFRPARVDGIGDEETFDTLRRLVGTLP
jgi:N-acetylmuramoyl-L-alanine amidase